MLLISFGFQDDMAEIDSLLKSISKANSATRTTEEESSIFSGIKRFFKVARGKFLLRIFLAFIITLIGFVAYYGHASNTSNLGSNMHLSFVFAALVEIPAFSVPFIINYAGRRWTLFVCFLASGVSSILYVSTPESNHQEPLRLKFPPQPLQRRKFGLFVSTGASG